MLSRRSGAAAAVLACRILGAAANVGAVLVLSRALPAGEVGLVLTALACAVLGELVVSLGREGLAIQVLPQAPPPVVARYLADLRALLSWTLPLGAVGTGTAFWLVTGGEASVALVLTTAFLPVFGSVIRVGSRLAHARGRIAESAVLFLLLRPALFACGVGALALAGTLSAERAVGVMLAAAGLGAAIQLHRLRAVRPLAAAPRGDAETAWPRAGLSLLLTSLLLGDLVGLVTVVAALSMDEAQVAVLGVALRFAALLQLGGGALIAALGPALSAAWGRKDRDGAVRIGRQVARIALPLVAVGALVAAAFAPILLGVFGPAYANGAPALRVLILMPLATAAAGPSLLVLTAAGRATEGAKAAMVAAPLVAGGVLVGAALGGVFGAAIGVVVGHFVWEVTLARRLYRATGVSLWLPFGPRAPE